MNAFDNRAVKRLEGARLIARGVLLQSQNYVIITHLVSAFALTCF